MQVIDRKSPFFGMQFSQSDYDWIVKKVAKFHKLTADIEKYVEGKDWSNRNIAIIDRKNCYLQVIDFFEKHKNYYYNNKFYGLDPSTHINKALYKAFGEYHKEQIKEYLEDIQKSKELYYRI